MALPVVLMKAGRASDSGQIVRAPPGQGSWLQLSFVQVVMAGKRPGTAAGVTAGTGLRARALVSMRI